MPQLGNDPETSAPIRRKRTPKPDYVEVFQGSRADGITMGRLTPELSVEVTFARRQFTANGLHVRTTKRRVKAFNTLVEVVVVAAWKVKP